MYLNAGWETGANEHFICRWFVGWDQTPEGGMIGAIAGYSGAGTFEVERFRAWTSHDQLTSLWIDFTDRISNEEIDFNNLPAEELTICEQALDELWTWNDNEIWNENDNIVLIDKLLPKLLQQNELFIYKTATNPFLPFICKKAGLTSAP